MALEKNLAGYKGKIDHIEAATPRTIKHYTQHANGATFGTKFEGLEVSSNLPKYAPGLFHAGSVGIIMSGWLGTINYGVITANKIDSFLRNRKNDCPRKSPMTRILPLPLPESCIFPNCFPFPWKIYTEEFLTARPSFLSIRFLK